MRTATFTEALTLLPQGNPITSYPETIKQLQHLERLGLNADRATDRDRVGAAACTL
eukprot:SAG11_NODE_4904_length_1727_cov_1.605037_1_plen_56_part_00